MVADVSCEPHQCRNGSGVSLQAVLVSFAVASASQQSVTRSDQQFGDAWQSTQRAGDLVQPSDRPGGR
jgi:hypothetical protein